MKLQIVTACKLAGIVFLALLISCSVSILSRKDPMLKDHEVVLTFDDGPNTLFSTSEKLLEVLKKHNVKAYFCIIGSNAEHAPDIIRQIHDDGHILVNHSYTDRPIIFKSETIVQNEIRRTNRVIQSILGDTVAVQWYRPPYGMYQRNLTGILHDENMRMLPFSLYALDADLSPEHHARVGKKIWKYLDKNNKAILLLHDGKDGYQKMAQALRSDSLSKYNRAWIPAFTDSLLTQLEKKNYRVVLLAQ